MIFFCSCFCELRVSRIDKSAALKFGLHRRKKMNIFSRLWAKHLRIDSAISNGTTSWPLETSSRGSNRIKVKLVRSSSLAESLVLVVDFLFLGGGGLHTAALDLIKRRRAAGGAEYVRVPSSRTKMYTYITFDGIAFLFHLDRPKGCVVLSITEHFPLLSLPSSICSRHSGWLAHSKCSSSSPPSIFAGSW